MIGSRPSDFALWYWSVWGVVTAAGFLGYEAYALATAPRNTLSNLIWWLERFTPGQPVYGWDAFHLLFIGLFALMNLWLLGHFALGWWR